MGIPLPAQREPPPSSQHIIAIGVLKPPNIWNTPCQNSIAKDLPMGIFKPSTKVLPDHRGHPHWFGSTLMSPYLLLNRPSKDTPEYRSPRATSCIKPCSSAWRFRVQATSSTQTGRQIEHGLLNGGAQWVGSTHTCCETNLNNCSMQIGVSTHKKNHQTRQNCTLCLHLFLH